MFRGLIDSAAFYWKVTAAIAVVAVVAVVVATCGCLIGCRAVHRGDGEIGIRYGTEVTFFNRTLSEPEASFEIESQPLLDYLARGAPTGPPEPTVARAVHPVIDPLRLAAEADLRRRVWAIRERIIASHQRLLAELDAIAWAPPTSDAEPVP